MCKLSRVKQTVIKSLFYIYILAVFFLSLYSFGNTDIKISPRFFGIESDKIIHFIMFFPFPALARYSLKCKSYLYILLSGLLISGIAEMLQNLVPERSFELCDIAANFLAIISGTFLVFTVDKINKSKNDRSGRLQ